MAANYIIAGQYIEVKIIIIQPNFSQTYEVNSYLRYRVFFIGETIFCNSDINMG